MSETIKLITPDAQLKDAFLDMVKEYAASGPLSYFHRLASDDFDGFLTHLDEFTRGINLKLGYVRMDSYWLALGDRLVGETRLRHELNEDLLIEGGNIGYTIRPADRRKGYGTMALALTLERARALGLTRVLVTCDSDNIGSARIIKKNVGVLEAQAISPESGKLVSRYWIEL